MSEAPAMPVFCDAYLADTMHLSLDEHGAYVKILMVTWRNNGIPLKDDPKRIARVLGISVSRWVTKLRPVIIGFFDVTDGNWNIRLGRHIDSGNKRLPSNQWSIIRLEIFARDNFTCTYCGAKDRLECDHIIPISRGGSNLHSNLTTACSSCNRSKADFLISEWSGAL